MLQFNTQLLSHYPDYLEFEWAVGSGNLHLVESLLRPHHSILPTQSRVDPSCKNNYALKLACSQGNLAMVQLLVGDLRVDVSAEDQYCLRIAAELGHTWLVEWLLRSQREKVDPSVRNQEAIRWAAAGGHLEIVRWLLQDTRVQPCVDGCQLVCQAIHEHQEELAVLFLEDARVDVNQVVHTCWHVLVKHHKWILPALLRLSTARALDLEGTNLWPWIQQHRDWKLTRHALNLLARHECTQDDRNFAEDSQLCTHFSRWLEQKTQTIQGARIWSESLSWTRQWVHVQWKRLQRLFTRTVQPLWLHQLYKPKGGLLVQKVGQRFRSLQSI